MSAPPDLACPSRIPGRPARRGRPVGWRAGCCSTGCSRSGPEADEAPRQAAGLVEGDVPDRRRLLLHPVLPARHRGAGRRRAVAAGDAADRRADAARHAADVPAGGRRRARTGRARWRCWRTCCRSGAARCSCWCCSASSPPRGSSRSRCPRPTPRVHLLENPYLPDVLHGHAVAITVVLLLILGGVFLLGFSEAVGVAIPLVAVFLRLNAVIVVGRPGRGVHHARRAVGAGPTR